MALTSLRKVLPPPATPTETTGAGSWPPVEASLGIHLPGDYKEFIDVYGTGVIGDFLWVFNPFVIARRNPTIRYDNRRPRWGTISDAHVVVLGCLEK